MDSPHSKLLKYSTTDPLLVQLLEQADQLKAADSGNGNGTHAFEDGNGTFRNRSRSKKWSSQFTSLTDMAGWMTASPWYKWKEKRRFPVKLFLHTSIAILSLFQIVFLSTSTGKVIRNTKSLMDGLLLTEAAPVFNLTGLINAANRTMCEVCAYEKDSLVVFDLKGPFELKVDTLRDGGQIFNTSKPHFSMDTESDVYTVYCSDCPNSLADTGLDTRYMSEEERQRLRHSLSGIGVKFSIEQLTYLEGGRYCLDWEIDIWYAISLRIGTLTQPRIRQKATGCGHWPRDPMYIPLVWVNLWLLLFSFWSFVLVVRQFGRHYQLYSAVTKEIKQIEMGAAHVDLSSEREKRTFLETWSKLSSIRKTKFFSLWHLFTISTNILQTAGSFILLVNHGRSGNVLINTLIGLTASGALLNMVRRSLSLPLPLFLSPSLSCFYAFFW